MIRVSIQIENGTNYDSYSQYGFIYLSSDHRFEAPIKDMESTSYPEESGVHYNNKVVQDAFEYRIKFLVEGNSVSKINARIATFNAAMYTATQGSDIRTLKRVKVSNPYKGVQIEGYPMPISEASDFWRDHNGNKYGAAEVDWIIKVDDPSKCNFNYSDSGSDSGSGNGI